MLKATLFFMLTLICEYECARILCFFSIGLYSRQAMLRVLTRELASRGHELVVMTTKLRPPEELIPNLTEIDLSINSKNITSQSQVYSDMQSEKIVDPIRRLKSARELTWMEFEKQIQTRKFQELLRSRREYDLLIVDSAAGCPALVLSHVFQIPAVLVRSCVPLLREHEVMGSEMYSQFLYLSRTKLSNLNIYDAAELVYNEYRNRQSFLEIEPILDDIMRRNFGPDIPPMEEMWENVQALIVNVHRLWGYNLPVSPNIIYMGNIVQKTEKPLPQEIQAYLDRSVHGVIYISFGSIFDFSMLPLDIRNVFFYVFKVLPYDILMKSKNELKGTPENVKTYKWLPQSDVLRHPKIKLFITQGGVHSIDEAISAGVPLLGVPMFSDQFENIQQCTKFKIGVKIDLNSITKELLLDAINTVIEDPSYAEATHRLRARMQQRISPLETAVLTVERILRSETRAHRQQRFPELPLLAAAALAALTILAFIAYLAKFTSTAFKIMFQRFHLTLRYVLVSFVGKTNKKS